MSVDFFLFIFFIIYVFSVHITQHFCKMPADQPQSDR